MELKPVTQKFILHWGEMGTRWDVNRTVSQIHTLLYLAGRPLPAEEIAETLGVARSNISTSLRELQNWGLVKIMHVMGDRRDHFMELEDHPEDAPITERIRTAWNLSKR
jgi:DNA-binding transcriptional regulator GbsR (MarR family)